MRRPVLILALGIAVLLAVTVDAQAYQKEAAFFGGEVLHQAMAQDCILGAYNVCSCWIWLFTDVPGAVWGVVLDPDDCAGRCDSGGSITDFWIYSRCEIVGDIGGLGISFVDASDCLAGEIFTTGQFTTTHCVPGDRYTHIEVPSVHVYHERFAVTITWGVGDLHLATDNALANLLCSFGVTSTFPGCFNSTCTCSGWRPHPAATYIYKTDLNGDTRLDDLCEQYGYPYALAFPYYYPYGYLPNNLVLTVGLDCTYPHAVEQSSWGKVKALYE